MLVAGCATRRQMLAPARPATSPSTQPAAKDDLTLDQIEPKPSFPSTHPSPTTEPAPIEALMLFAEARDAMLQGQRFTAINILEKAIKLDPYSYELRYWLGEAYGGVGS